LTPIAEDVADAANAGTLVSALISGAVADVDGGAPAGIAVTAADTAHGTWQFKLSGASSWSVLADGTTTPSASAARLLPDTALVRFVPAADYNTTSPPDTAPGLTYRAWDQSDIGTHGAGSTVNL